MYTPTVVRFADDCATDSNRIPMEEIAELIEQMNCNLHDEPEGTAWLDREAEMPEHMQIVEAWQLFDYDPER